MLLSNYLFIPKIIIDWMSKVWLQVMNCKWCFDACKTGKCFGSHVQVGHTQTYHRNSLQVNIMLLLKISNHTKEHYWLNEHGLRWKYELQMMLLWFQDWEILWRPCSSCAHSNIPYKIFSGKCNVAIKFPIIQRSTLGLMSRVWFKMIIPKRCFDSCKTG